MQDVYSIMIWLKESGVIPLEVTQQNADPSELPKGHRSFVFNSPALPRVQFAHYAKREAAETALKKLCSDIDAGKTVLASVRDVVFAIPAHSIHYVVLASAKADRVNPYSDTEAPVHDVGS